MNMSANSPDLVSSTFLIAFYTKFKIYIPDKVPTPMTSVSTTVSKVIVGPRTDIPLAMLFFTSSWLEALRANSANMAALVRSISNRKKNRASL